MKCIRTTATYCCIFSGEGRIGKWEGAIGRGREGRGWCSLEGKVVSWRCVYGTPDYYFNNIVCLCLQAPEMYLKRKITCNLNTKIKRKFFHKNFCMWARHNCISSDCSDFLKLIFQGSVTTV